MRRITFFLALVILLSPAVHAQMDDSQFVDEVWHVLLMDLTTPSVYHITEDGVMQIDLPFMPVSYATSYNGNYLALMDEDVYVISMLNVWENLCCEGYLNPFAEQMDQFVDFGIGAVSPDGTQLAFYMLTPQEGAAQPMGEIAVSEMLGTVIDSINIFDVTFAENAPLPYFGDWTAGIEFLPTCFACDGAYSGNYTVWIPGVGGGFSLNGVHPFGDYLALTGESVVRVRDENYELLPEEFYGPFNALHYDPGMEMPPATVYVDPQSDVRPARWITDGAAVIFHANSDPQPQILYRDGRQLSWEYAAESRFLAGTPDGWLAATVDTGEVFHFVMDENGAISAFPLGEIAHPAFNETRVIAKPRLGLSSAGTEFVSVMP